MKITYEVTIVAKDELGNIVSNSFCKAYSAPNALTKTEIALEGMEKDIISLLKYTSEGGDDNNGPTPGS